MIKLTVMMLNWSPENIIDDQILEIYDILVYTDDRDIMFLKSRPFKSFFYNLYSMKDS